MQTPPLLPKKTNWVERNWKWAVPVLVLIIVAMIGLFIVGVMKLLKSSEAYSGAIAIAQSDSTVIAALGEPVQEGFFLTGNISTSGPSGRANLSAPLSGPKGEGTLHIRATKQDGQWKFDRLVLEVEDTDKFLELNRPEKQERDSTP